MALKATIYKAALNVADMDRQVYLDTTLTLAQHPSETEQRMMLRLLAWICHADERLTFTKGLCADDEPELWLQNDVSDPVVWIELGLPDEKRLRKASRRAERVILYAYSERAAKVWWQQNQQKLSDYDNLSVFFLDDARLAQLVALCERTMTLQATIQDGTIWLSSGDAHLELAFEVWQ